MKNIDRAKERTHDLQKKHPLQKAFILTEIGFTTLDFSPNIASKLMVKVYNCGESNSVIFIFPSFELMLTPTWQCLRP